MKLVFSVKVQNHKLFWTSRDQDQILTIYLKNIENSACLGDENFISTYSKTFIEMKLIIISWKNICHIEILIMLQGL